MTAFTLTHYWQFGDTDSPASFPTQRLKSQAAYPTPNVHSPVTIRTHAGVAVHRIDALSSIFTLILLAVVEIDAALLTHVTWGTLTPVTRQTTPDHQPITRLNSPADVT